MGLLLLLLLFRPEDGSMTPGHLDRTPALQTGQWTHQLQLYCTVAILYSIQWLWSRPYRRFVFREEDSKPDTVGDIYLGRRQLGQYVRYPFRYSLSC